MVQNSQRITLIEVLILLVILAPAGWNYFEAPRSHKPSDSKPDADAKHTEMSQEPAEKGKGVKGADELASRDNLKKQDFKSLDDQDARIVEKSDVFSGDSGISLFELQANADGGDPHSQYLLATRYRDGRGAPQNCDEALRWFRKAVENGSVEAQTDLGILYETGGCVDKRPDIATRWYLKASKKGYAPAQAHLAKMYADGNGVRRNPRVAEKWYLAAAEQGLAAAQYELGKMYAEGDEYVRDGAFRANFLGKSFIFGDGSVKRNHELAIKWLKAAASQGHKSAQDLLYVMTGSKLR